ncbi:MAG: phage head closure protein [Pseudomonadota bacterium]
MKKNFTSCLKQVITIQKPLSNNNVFELESGEAWQDFATIRAEVRAIFEKTSGEAVIAMQLMDNSYYRFRIRFMPNLQNNMRIIYEKRKFEIKRIINQDEQNLISIIIAQENI